MTLGSLTHRQGHTANCSGSRCLMDQGRLVPCEASGELRCAAAGHTDTAALFVTPS